MQRAPHGFTLFDLLVALAIAAVLMTLAVPTLQAWSRRHAMAAAMSSLQSDLRFARAEAVRLRVPVQACPVTPDGRCAELAQWHHGWRIFADLNGDRAYAADEPSLRLATALEGLAISSPQSRQHVRFSPLGTAPGSNASLTFCDDRGPSFARQLRISASGRIRLLEAAEAQVSSC